MVDFSETNGGIDVGNYQLVLNADANTGSAEFTPVSLNVHVQSKTTYSLVARNNTKGNVPTAVIKYDVVSSEGSNDSYAEGKTLAMVLKAENNGEQIPKDVCFKVGEDAYRENSQGVFIIPIGTIKSGEMTLSMLSDMFPDEEKTYSFAGSLYLVNSNQVQNPLNGECVAKDVRLVFEKSAESRPAISVSGQRVAAAAEWANGQEVNFKVQNIPENGTVTVTAYKGMTGNQKITDLISSVSGVFTMQNGMGTYDESKSPTGTLKLSGSAESGNYRLIFEVKNSDGTVMLTVPYYIIVQ